MEDSDHIYLFLSKGCHPQVYGYLFHWSYDGLSPGHVTPVTWLVFLFLLWQYYHPLSVMIDTLLLSLSDLSVPFLLLTWAEN